MTKAEQTRQFIIEKTAPIFNKKGYAGTSLSDITNATGLTKGSIYGNFLNKEEVGLAVFKYNTKELSRKTEAWISKKNNAYEQLIAFLNFYRVNWKTVFENGGCPILNSAAESDDVMPAMKALVRSTFENWEDYISAMIDEGRQKELFKKEINVPEYSKLFIMMIEGGILFAKISDDPADLYLVLNRIKKIIDVEIIK
ncbi:TetR family transcriptional regulator [Chryseobacterium glaciei]|uniref:TetR family transcriptional regulator n=1 Tax=Chryseobacterium glaciei TaxID=1685010 RepID=A0A172XQ58_9FLAO|nr:TetR/AcrR family transcriptional regulator [Chryseobacterium glaciei]ANF49157.1 TetR family transcriptional regulator [Chryseobacterium glaciei]